MRKGYESRVISELGTAADAGRIIDLRGRIREMQLQSVLCAERDEEATYFVLPGNWSMSEFRDLLAAAA